MSAGVSTTTRWPAGRTSLSGWRRRVDGVIPSANSVMLMNLLDLYELTGEASWLDEASATLGGLSSRIRRSPRSTALATASLHRFLDRFPERVAGQAPDAPLPPDAPSPPDAPVEVALSSGTVTVSAGAPGALQVTLKIDDGYHVNAHEPGVAGLTGLTIRLVGRGLALEVEYPQGEPFRNKLFEDELLVHTGTVTIPLTVQQTGPWQGRARLVLTYQVCTDQVCLQPAQALLPVKIVK